MKRTVLKVAGESGMGLLSVGRIVAKVLKDMGFYVHSDREYPSLIKGGHSNLQIDFGAQPINCLSEQVDLVIALDLAGLMEYIETIKPGGILLHGYDRHHLIKKLQQKAEERQVKLIYFPALPTARKLGGRDVMMNVVLLGLMWRILGFDLNLMKQAIEKEFAKKPKVIPLNLQCLEIGYAGEGLEEVPKYNIPIPETKPDTLLLDGNMAIALGAIEAGVRAHYQYPMSPSSSILMHLANFSHHSQMIVKQAEDEITAAQMAYGSMLMGTRALTATSGGGFDLMSETVSLVGITEVPWVCVLCQRPGPGTGLPTWTGQGDLNLAIHAGHGEFARLVIAASDPTSGYEGIQKAMNYAETYQIPVILLTEKVICESQTLVPPLRTDIPIERGLVTDPEELANLKSVNRYEITENGISRRWIPGSSPAGYYSNGDEHREDGTLTEKGEEAGPMYAKRNHKMDTLKANLPEPVLYGEENADISVVGWGSTKSTMLDVIVEMAEQGIKVNYLHYEYLWPLKTERFKQLMQTGKPVHLLEGNYHGQLGVMLEGETGLKFTSKFLKYNGRPFFLEEVIKYLKPIS